MSGYETKANGYKVKGAVSGGSGGTGTGTGVPPATSGVYLFDHFLNVGASTSGAQFLSTAVSGAASGSASIARADRWGLLQLTTGTATTGRAALQTSFLGLAGPGFTAAYRFKLGRTAVPILSTGVETFQVIAGFGDNLSGAANDGAYFTCDSNSNANWQCTTAVGGSRTTVNSNVPVVAGQEYDLQVTLSAGSAVFTIDGVTVATIVLTLPTTSVFFGVVISAVKSAGTTARTMEADYCELEITA